MPRGGRSRSPRAGADGPWTSNKLSRVMVQFGRYPQKRPAGLYVDDTGGFRLGDFMQFWGSEQGLNEEEVIDAVKANMFHEDGRELRFCIDNDSEGFLVIRVMQKRRQGAGPSGGAQNGYASKYDNRAPVRAAHEAPVRAAHGGGSRRAAKWGGYDSHGGAAAGGGSHRPANGEGHYESYRPRGSVGAIPPARNQFPSEAQTPPWKNRAPPPAPPQCHPRDRPGGFVERLLLRGISPAGQEAESEAPPPATPSAPNLSTQDKLEMSLDDLVRQGVRPMPTAESRRGDLLPELGPAPPADISARCNRVRQAFCQMGLTPATANIRLEANKAGREGKRGRTQHSDTTKSDGEQLTRWMSWVFKTGHRELQVGVRDDGCIRIEELAAAMAQARPMWNGFDATKLRESLEKGDAGGRFQVIGEWLRKVPREERPNHVDRMNDADENGRGSSSRPHHHKARDKGSAAPRSRSGSAASSSSSGCNWRRSLSPSPTGGGAATAAREDPTAQLTKQLAAAARISSPKVLPEHEAASAAAMMQLDGGAGTVPSPMEDGTTLHQQQEQHLQQGGAVLETPPNPAPGLYWQQFQDTESTRWWYYEGPVGQWWCWNAGDEPQKYSEDAL